MDTMAEQSTGQGRGPVGGLVDMAARLVQLQIDLVAGGVRAATAVLVPVARVSLDMSVGMLRTYSRVLEGVTQALVPKKAQAPQAPRV
ncbi:hypothetical protein [Chlorobium sp. N1]|uniref:hypothetical protein n=1 Tax=Chlorobium sp. N1 TaxID=2491138 RepID=UPI001038698F|nr:hypothetical protein [Chlorobium sp. N1]TCD47245.1 hypothetical protein E0L29_09185 [Chlorobium sp. N1]